MCQRAKVADLLPLADTAGTFTCQVSKVKGSGTNSTTVTEALTVVIATSFGKTTADRSCVWRVGMQKGAQAVEKHGLTKTSRLLFPSGSPVPPGVTADTWYSVAPSGTFYFDLANNPIGAAAVLPPNASLTVHRCQTGQFNVRDEAMKYHQQTDPSRLVVDWASIRAERLLDAAQCGDFAKMFVSAHSNKEVDLFESQENGEFMFLMIQWCTEFRKLSSFLSSDAQRDVFHRTVGTAIDDLAKNAKLCRERRNTLGHSLERIERAVALDEDVENAQGLFECVECFLSSIVKIVAALENAGCIRAEDERHFEVAVQAAQEGLAELQGLAGKKIVVTSEMEAEKQGLIDEIRHLRFENERLANAAAEADRQRQESERQQQELELQKEEADRLRRRAEAVTDALVHKTQSGPDRVQQVLQGEVLGSLHLGTGSCISKLQEGWAQGSREACLKKVMDAVMRCSARSVTWLHGHHGSGKSSLLSKVVQQLSGVSGTVVLSHFFIFGNAASSVELSIALLCANLWVHAFGSDASAARKYFEDWVPSSESVTVRMHLQQKTVSHFTALMLRMVKDAVKSGTLSRLVIVLDALDECSDRHCDVEVDSQISVSDPVVSLTDEFLTPFLDGIATCDRVSVSVVASSITKPTVLPAATLFINIGDHRPSPTDIQSFVEAWLHCSVAAQCLWVGLLRDRMIRIFRPQDASGQRGKHVSDLRAARLLVQFVAQQAFICMESEHQDSAELSRDTASCVDMTIKLLADADMTTMALTYIAQSVLDAGAANAVEWAASVDAASAAVCIAAYLGTSEPVEYAQIARFGHSKTLEDRVRSSLRPLLLLPLKSMRMDPAVLDVMRRNVFSPIDVFSAFKQRLKPCLSALSRNRSDLMRARIETSAFEQCCCMLFDKQVLLSKVHSVFSSFVHDDAATAVERLQYLFMQALAGKSAACAADVFMMMSKVRCAQPDALLPVVPAELGALCSLMMRGMTKRCLDDAAAAALRIADLDCKCKLLVAELKRSVLVGSWWEQWDLRYDTQHLVSVLQLLLKMGETDAMDDVIVSVSHMVDEPTKTLLWNVLLNANGSNVGTHAAEDIMRRMVGLGIRSNVVTWNTLMNAYAAAGNAAKCEELMAKMQAQPHSITPNVTTWNTLMNAYAAAGNAAKCEELMAKMQAQPHSITPDVTTWSTLMNAYAAAGNAAKCEELMAKMQAQPHSITPNVTTWSTLMKAYLEFSKSRKGCGGEGCLRAFERMVSCKVSPDSVTLSTLFSTLSYGLKGSRPNGAAKIILLSKQWVNPRSINHHVAGGVLRALADAGTVADVNSFWQFCEVNLGRSRQGWPGSSYKILNDLSQRLSGQGQWSRIAALLAQRR